MHVAPPATVRRPVSAAVLQGTPKRRRKERIIGAAFFVAAALTVLVSVLIVASLLGKAIGFLSSIRLAQLFAPGWFPRRSMFDLRTIVVGTLLVTGIAMVVAAPLGLGAAIYLAEYASRRVRAVLKPALEILAGIPSVVMGFFALTFISPELVRRISQSAAIFNVAAAGIGVGILVTPLVASIAEDAMFAVPRALREASYGLGARKFTTSVRVVVPAAASGIVAALIVGISRAIGETMVVAIAAGATGGSRFTVNLFGPGQTMTGAMAALATGTDQVRGAATAFQSLFFVGLILFAMTLALNIASDRFVRRLRSGH